MKTKTILVIAAIIGVLGAGFAVARPGGFLNGMMGTGGMMNGYGTGNGMMGTGGMMGGYGTGNGMMGTGGMMSGYGTGNGMMGTGGMMSGYGTGNGMMGTGGMMSGYGTGNGMMGTGGMMSGYGTGNGMMGTGGMMSSYGTGNDMMGTGGMMSGYGTGNDMMGNGSMMAGSHCSGAGTPGYGANATPITIDEAKTAVDKYLAGTGNTDLELAEVLQFENNFYAGIKEKSTRKYAFELIVNKYTGTVIPEMGPNMMWNAKYGHMNIGESGTKVSREQALKNAQEYLDSSLPGTKVNDADDFYGYYTMEVIKDGNIYGMLSVNSNTGAVWYHNWHGTFEKVLEVK